MDALETRMDTLEKRIDCLEEKINTLTDLVIQSIAQISKLTENVQALRGMA